MFVSFCCVHLLGYHWDNVNKTALFVLVCIFKDHWHFSIEKELKIELHRHCNSNNGASYFRCASSHSSEGLHFKPTVLFLNWWICAGARLSSGLEVKRVSELGLWKHCYKHPAIPTFLQLPLVFGEYNLHWIYIHMSVLSPFFAFWINPLCTYISYINKVKRCLTCCAVV